MIEKYARLRWRIADVRFTKQKDIQLVSSHSLFEQNSMLDEIDKSSCTAGDDDDAVLASQYEQ